MCITMCFMCLCGKTYTILLFSLLHSVKKLNNLAGLQFQLQHTDINSRARTGKIVTDHGEILTPIFMPVGTVGSVKAVTQQQLLQDVKAQIILGNTYHLYLRPGTEVLEAAGGLHKFNGWD